MQNQSVVFKAFAVGVVYLLAVAFLTMNGPLGCSSSSGDSGDEDDGGGGDEADETFESSSGNLRASTTEGSSSKTTTITNESGDTLVTAVTTVSGVTLTFPGVSGETTIDFTETLSELPSNFSANRLAAYVAGFVELDDDGSLLIRPDNPGCDLFPDTNCTLHCCADHDRCFDENGCSASSWLPFVGSSECDNCNAVAAGCIMQACSGIIDSDTNDNCYDNRCGEYYSACSCGCNDAGLFGFLSCDCPSPCDTVSPDNCGNGTCEVDEDSDNCYADCVSGDAVNQCCATTDNCPSEEAFSCPGSCCCCGSGEVCGSASLCITVANISAPPTLQGAKKTLRYEGYRGLCSVPE